MTQWVNVGGVWRKVTVEYTKVAGVWKSSTASYVNVGAGAPRLYTAQTFQQIYSTSTSANQSTYTYTNVNINAEHPHRRLLIHFNTCYLPSGTLTHNCTVNGVAAELLYAALPVGYAITSQFSAWLNRDAIFVSQPIPTGTTATISYTPGAPCALMGINMFSVVGPKPRLTNTVRIYPPTTETRVVNNEGLVLIKQAGTISTSQVSNATRRWNELQSGYYHRSADYINTTGTTQTVLFQSTTNDDYYVHSFGV